MQHRIKALPHVLILHSQINNAYPLFGLLAFACIFTNKAYHRIDRPLW